jgi:mannose-6-phosphate isomerase-like protein (cupin superfamily)
MVEKPREDEVLFQEPDSELHKAGRTVLTAHETPYDRYMRGEGIPTHRDIGFADIKQLELAPWARTGGNGAFIQLLGTEGKAGMHLLEIPPRAALNVEHHLYEEIFFVMEGRGTTELEPGVGGPGHMFEWQAGSLFAVPLNVEHRLINATDKRALLLVGTSAPPVFNLYDTPEFIFGDSFRFTNRYNGEQDYFQYKDTFYADPRHGRAIQITSFLPDIVDAEMPMDNQRTPGMRRTEPHMAGSNFYLKIMQQVIGRYTKAHFHAASAVLICLKGKGYTFTWPKHLGHRPFADGNGHLVKRVDYGPGGIVAAAPGGGDWFHQHFATGREPLRLLVYNGPMDVFSEGHAPGEEIVAGHVGMEEGGRSVEYRNEDPYFREEFERMLALDGLTSTMPDSFYEEKSSSHSH